MVALDKQFDHHHGTKPRSSVRWRDESWQAGKSPGRRTAEILPARSHRDTSSSSNTSCANDIIYCGYRFDPETQLYYVRNRTYNAVLGRWIQRDPVGYAGGINLYEYVGGMACSLMDGSGLGCFTDQMALYGAIVAVGTASVAAGIACRVAIVLKPEGEADLAVIAACIAAELIALGAFAGMVFALAALIHCEKAEPCPDKSEIKRQERRLHHLRKEMQQMRREIRRLRDKQRGVPTGGGQSA